MNNENPKKVVDAVLAPSPLTMAQVVLLEKIESPLLFGDMKDTSKNLETIYLLELPVTEAAKKIKDGSYDLDAIAWAETLKVDEYRAKLEKWLGGIEAFWAMLPRPEEDSKKAAGSDSETAG